MMESRIQLDKRQGTEHEWNGVILNNILDVYNNKDIHRSIKMTPAEGRMKKNESIVKAHLQLNAKHNRKYPALKKGNKVKVFRKKSKKELKERFSNWAPRIWTVADIKEEKGQELYFLEDQGVSAPKTYLRFELLKVVE